MDRPNDEVEAPRIDPHKPEVSETLGEAAGGVSGAITGGALGSLGGPIGSIVGAIAGAIAGWWAGHTIAEEARQYDREYDPLYREQLTPKLPADLSFDDIRPALQLGYLAGANPDWTGRRFDDVEAELRRGWETVALRLCSWESVRDYARDTFDSARAGRPVVLEEHVTESTLRPDVARRATDGVDDLRA
ncbi:MAG TPA: hypothetical protein VNW46_19820 [Gemmatimonadaceae bacterium]|jgi:hypothetical protein|nr:hypothetical protein [Gemmatimonadaceae bacterium]